MATSKKAAAKTTAKKAAKRASQKSVRAERALQSISHAGLTFGHKHHIFVAKVKSSEIWALNQLTGLAKSAVTPLFEMWPPNPATPTKAAKTVVTHTTDVMTTVLNDWGTLPFFLDTRYMPLGGVPSATQASTVFSIARNAGLNAIPVTSLAASPAYQQAMQQIAATDGRGLMIRLTTQDFTNAPMLSAYLSALLGVLQLAVQQVDIALDLEYRANQLEVQNLGQSILNMLPFLDQWRTVTLISGCFPQASPAQALQWISVPRVDWLGWNTIVTSQMATGGRIPTYGDYGTRCGGPPVVIPVTPGPYLRYTDPRNILTRKGPKTNGVLQALCADLVSRAEFAGSAFSEGDRLIAERAAMPGSQNNGQPSQWIQWCTNHHLELVAWQIRNLP